MSVSNKTSNARAASAFHKDVAKRRDGRIVPRILVGQKKKKKKSVYTKYAAKPPKKRPIKKYNQFKTKSGSSVKIGKGGVQYKTKGGKGRFRTTLTLGLS